MAAIQLTATWQKIATAGQTVEVQNASVAPAYIMTGSGGAPATTDGIELSGDNPSRVLVLTADLYARCDGTRPVRLVLMTGFAVATTGGGATVATAAASRSPLFAFGLLGAAA